MGLAGRHVFSLFFMGLGIIALVSIAIAIVVCIVLSDCFKRIPKQFRQMEPGMVWLLLIPCFGLVWNFLVFPKLSASYKAYFDSIGRTDVGPCGAGLALGYAICAACGIIPCAGYIAALASIVLLVLYLIEAVRLKNLIPVS